MKIITATVNQQNLIIASSVISVAESVGAYSLKITYDAEWGEADKIVTFKNSAGVAIAVEDTGSEDGVTIPWEILRCPGKVTVGVMGYIGSEQKLATTGIYERNTFIVLPAAFGLQEAMTPTPDIYQKLIQTIETMQSQIGDLANLNTEAKNNLVAAINEVLAGGGATGTVKSVNNIEPDSAGNVSLNTSQIPNTSDFQTGTQVANAIAAEAAARSEADNQLSSGINTIESKIPTQASSSNQLADKNFVNSSVATNTANYISNNGEPFTSLADLEAYSGALTNNDYAFVVGADAQGNTTYTRYKYVASTESWAEEYVLNNSSFTAEQWAAISSGITSGLVEKLGGLVAIKSLGANLSLDQDGELSATDTTYSDFTGTDGTAAGAHGLVPAPATTDASKFLKADGTWDTVSAGSVKTLTTADYNYPTGSPTYIGLWLLPDGLYYKPSGVLGRPYVGGDDVGWNFIIVETTSGGAKRITCIGGPLNVLSNGKVKGFQQYETNATTGSYQTLSAPLVGQNLAQTTGTSQIDVMSQNAVTRMVFANPITKDTVQIGGGASAPGAYSLVIGKDAIGRAQNSIAIGIGASTGSALIGEMAIGASASATGQHGVALGTLASASGKGSLAVGGFSSATVQGQMDIGTYETAFGYNSSNYRLISGVYDGQGLHDAATVGQITPTTDSSAPTSSTAGRLGEIRIDTTDNSAYMCVAVSGSTYTWKQITA